MEASNTITPNIIMACGNTRLEKRLKDCGVHFVRSDIGGFDDLMETVADVTLGATHAIIHQSIFLGKPFKKSLNRLSSLNPDLKIILIMPKISDERLSDHALALQMDIVEDNSSALPQILLSKLNVEDAATESASAPTLPIPVAPAPEPVAQKDKDKAPDTALKKKKQAPERKPYQAPNIVKTLANIPLPSFSVTSKPQKTQSVKVTKNTAPSFVPDIVPKRTVIISVFCTSHGAGGTWLSTQIAAYLSKHGKTAVSGDKDICFITKKKYKEGDPHFTYQGIDFYAFTPLMDILPYGYQYIVLDAGVPLTFSRERHEQISISPAIMADMMRSDLRISISEFSPWNDFVLPFYMTQERWSELMQGSVLTLSNRCAESIPDLLFEKFGRVFIPLPQCTAFEMTHEMGCFLAALLMSVIPNRNSSNL